MADSSLDPIRETHRRSGHVKRNIGENNFMAFCHVLDKDLLV